jgi:hypothetical protein
VLQYDNIPNAVITYTNDPSSAGQGIADNVSPAHHKDIAHHTIHHPTSE